MVIITAEREVITGQIIWHDSGPPPSTVMTTWDTFGHPNGALCVLCYHRPANTGDLTQLSRLRGGNMEAGAGSVCLK